VDRPVERPRHPAALAPEELLAQCTLERGRTSGPGGQHRNKVSTHVTLSHGPTGLAAQAGERREPSVNQKVALKRLRLVLATEHREAVPSGDARSAMWRERCRKGRIACNPSHADFPAMLAEALDFVAACGWDVKKAGVRLECSQSQIVKLVGAHPVALVRLNEQREERGMRPLKGR